MKRIKGLFVAALMAVVGLALVGCDDGAAQEGITFSSWSIGEAGSKDVLEGMVKDFNDDAEAADKVTPLVWTWGDTVSQFAIRYKGSEQFDVAQIDIRMLAPLAEAGYLADVKDLFGTDYLNENFDKASLEVGQFDGVQYGIPWTLAPMGMVYNPEILTAAGVTEAQIASMNTYAGFKDVLTTVQTNHPDNKDADNTNDILPFAAMSKDAGTVAPDLMPWLWANEGSVFDNGDVTKPTMSSDANKEVISYFKELADADLIQAGMDRGTARNLFTEERTM